MATSTYAATRAALFTRLNNHPLLTDKVIYGPSRVALRERIEVMAPERPADQKWAALAGVNKKRDETYDLAVIFTVSTPGKTQQQSVELCEEYVAAAESQLRVDPINLGVSGVIHAEVAEVTRQDLPESEGYGARAYMFVRVRARI